MSRTLPDASSDANSNLPRPKLSPRSIESPPARPASAWVARIFLLAASACITYVLSPFGVHGWIAAGAGVLLALAILTLEFRLRATPAANLCGGAIGGLAGGIAALLVTRVVSATTLPDSTKSFLGFASLLSFGYVGVMLGSEKAVFLRPDGLQVLRPRGAGPSRNDDGKLLDTSVLIDGRIAEICEAHFLDGPLLVPQFVLHELQMIADSADSLRRQRGRRGLEILQRIQKMETLEVRIIDDSPNSTNEVDRKLVELALRLRAKIVTNDFNLNKVASVQGISVLNVNLLANAVRPAFLPGEGMRVFILREGKEANQGVAYLEDGTMVVVDGARRLINKTIDILVTSVHQTPAGKMIFGRLDEHNDVLPATKQSATGGRTSRSNFPGSVE
jgi:uncharacterized protein YacL